MSLNPFSRKEEGFIEEGGRRKEEGFIEEGGTRKEEGAIIN
jgi:hypothetical protein